MIETNYRLYDLIEKGIEQNNRFICATKTLSGWKHIDKTQFREMIRYIALGLYESGVRKGDKVALHCENSNEWLMIDLAIIALGAITIPLYVTQSSEQLEYILHHSETKFLFVSKLSLTVYYEPFIETLSHIQKILLQPASHTAFENFENFISKGKICDKNNPLLWNELRQLVTPDDVATIAYTSGTTGTPKGVMLSHRNLAHAIQAPLKRCFHYAEMDIRVDTMLSFLPFTHVFEHCAIYGYLLSSLPVYIVPDVEDIKEALLEKKPVHFTTVPRLLERIYKTIHLKVQTEKGLLGYFARLALSKISDYRLNEKQNLLYNILDFLVFRKIRNQFGGNLRGITSGGAALSPHIMLFFNAIGIPVGQGYGLTETSPGLTLYKTDQLILGCAGLPFEDVELKIADDGEILAKGPNIMMGYYKDEIETEATLKDGWFYTGDIGYINKEGFLFITDRKKELLKLSTGKYIAPAPIENKLVAEDGIEQAVILGDNQKFCSALIVPTENLLRLDDKTLYTQLQKAIDNVNKDLLPWETIKKFVVSRDMMTTQTDELTPTHKKKRRVIAEKRCHEIEKIYSENER